VYTSKLSVVLLYGLHPVDLQSTAAVPRLNAQLMTMLAGAHPEWDFLAISPQAKPLPRVASIGVPLSASARAKARLFETRVGRRLYRPKLAKGQQFGKALWAEAASAQVAASQPDRPSTVVICTYPEAVMAVRRALPKAMIVHWFRTSAASIAAEQAADAAVVPSVAVYRDLWRRLDKQFPLPMWVIPHWVDADAFQPLCPEERRVLRAVLRLDEGDRVLVFIGRHWIKGAQVIERALALLPTVDRRVVLLSAGEPRQERRTVAPGREVWNLGLLPPTELRHIYGAAEIGVMPSVANESFGLACVEMMASGLPVIASRAGGLAEIIEDGITGRLVDLPNAVDAWVDAIASLLADAGARATLSAAARAAVLHRFTGERAQEEWTRVLLQLGSAS